MTKRSKAETERFYRRLVREQERSGLTIRAFARSRGMAAGTLSFWRHELRQRDAAAARDKSAEPQFVPVHVLADEAPSGVRSPAASSRRSSYEVLLGRGRVLRLPPDFDDSRVAALVRAVASC